MESKFGTPAESTRMKAFHAAIEVNMAAFDNHKEPLLAILRAAYDCGPKAEPFNDKRSWCRLERTAHQYFLQERGKQETMSSAECEARHRAIADALKQGRSLIENAMLNEVEDQLFSAWCEKADLPLTSVSRNEDGSIFVAHPAEETFKKQVAGLADLETAARRAADEAHQGRGRPPGTRVLPLGYIEALATQYRESTNSRPDPGPGSFIQFVITFLAALGRANISEEYVLKLAREARSSASTHPSGWAPSPFDE